MLKQHSTPTNLEGVHLHYKRFWKITMLQDVGWGKGSLQLFECLLRRHVIPCQFLGRILKQSCQWSRNHAESPFEGSVKACKPQEPLQVMYGDSCGFPYSISSEQMTNCNLFTSLLLLKDKPSQGRWCEGVKYSSAEALPGYTVP